MIRNEGARRGAACRRLRRSRGTPHRLTSYIEGGQRVGPIVDERGHHGCEIWAGGAPWRPPQLWGAFRRRARPMAPPWRHYSPMIESDSCSLRCRKVERGGVAIRHDEGSAAASPFSIDQEAIVGGTAPGRSDRRGGSMDHDKQGMHGVVHAGGEVHTGNALRRLIGAARFVCVVRSCR